MKFLMKIMLFVFLFFNLFLLIAQDNKRIEEKWGLDSDGDKQNSVEFSRLPKNFENVFPMHLEPFRPEVETSQINPNMENRIYGKFGTEIIIPANSISLPSFFRRGDVITIELREIVNDLDFLTFGVTMLFYDSKSRPNIFESGGMFEIKAIYFNRELNLKKGAKMKVNFPKIYSDRKMKVYKLSDNGSWTEKGESEETVIVDLERRSSSFGFLDGFGIWNFDYPNPEISCIQGVIEPAVPNPPYIVSVVGMDYAGAYSRSFNEVQFKINVPKNKEIKIIIGDSKGNFGTKNIRTPSTENFIDFNTYNKVKCEEVGKLNLELTSPVIRKDRKKLLDFLGLKDRMSPN